MDYTDNELLNILVDTSKRLGKTPRAKDVSQYGTIVHRFESWNKALKKAGLSVNRERSYTHIPNEQLISIVKNWIEENNKIPNRKEWDELDDVPSPETYRVRFNKTWSEFLEMIGYGKAKKNHYRFKNANISNKIIFNIFKKDIKKILEITHGAITTELYNEYKDPDSLSSSGLISRFNKTWSELLLLANCPKIRIYKYPFSKEELIEFIREIATKLEKTPSLNDLENEGLPESQIYNSFNAYQEALNEAQLDIAYSKIDDVKETKEELLQLYIDFCEKIGKVASAKDLDQSNEIYNAHIFSIRFNGLNNLRKLANLPTRVRSHPKYSKSELQTKLVTLYKENGGRVTIKELRKQGLVSTTIMRYFETTSMNNVWEHIEKIVLPQQDSQQKNL
ncbi:homing endonuclease associated repeat-containing protein [Bacillus cereus]